MAELIRGLSAETIAGNLSLVSEAMMAAGRGPGEVEVLAAVKYVPVDELGVLAEAGVTLVGENRAQDLAVKAQAHPGRFTWDFIGHLQSRKVRSVLEHVRYIHSVASDSVLDQLQRHADAATEVLIEVNVAGDPGKDGVTPEELPRFIDRCPVTVVGLMTMPPLAMRSEDSRPYFVALRQLAARHGLRHLSMGTSQDYEVALEEGATIVRLGTSLYAPRAA